MKIFYHNDLDGRAAGAIAYRATQAERVKGVKVELIEVNYKDEIKVKEINLCESIYILDFSFKPEVMEKVFLLTKNVVWIDHHKTAFEYKYSEELMGKRDNKFSGCELTWKYFYGEKTMPRAVKLIGDRDKWAWKMGKETAQFNVGLQLYDHQPKDEIWNILLIPVNKNLVDVNVAMNRIEVNKIVEEGSICLRFRDNFCKDYAKSYGFETIFEGYKCFALGLYMFAAEAFGDRIKVYDICLSFEYTGDSWVVGLYSDGKGIDVSKIAQRYGGGGHKGAAGFVAPELPFGKK